MQNLKLEIQKAINLYKSQKFLEAELFSKKLVKANPKVAFLYNLLGLVLAGQGKNDEAIKYYNDGINIEPNYAMIYNNLGAVYNSKKDYLKAESYYNKSIKLNDKLPETQNNLGNLYVTINKHKEAISSYKKSISINSNFYAAYYNLGILYKSTGNFADSKKYFEETIRLNPFFYNAHRALSQLHKYKKKNDSHIISMKKISEDNKTTNYGKMILSFALGKAFEDTKNFDEAFNYFLQGNKFRRKDISFSAQKEINEFENIKNTFNKNFFNKYIGVGNTDDAPIFIVGMPRSGTTLIEQIISSHPDVYGGDELNYFNDLIKKFYYKNNIYSIEAFNTNVSENFKTIGNEYLKEIKKLSKKNKKVTDKLPINFKWIGFIKLILPNSKIIHCVRDPKDVCMSIYKNFFANIDLNYAYNLDEVVSFYNLYNDLMSFWKKSLPEFITEVRYENLVDNPAKEIKKLIKNCDLKWNNNCIKFYNNKRPIKTASDTQVREKMYKSSINSWKNYKKYLEKSFAKLEYKTND